MKKINNQFANITYIIHFNIMYLNRFKLLEIPLDPTDYEDYEDIVPYNKLKNGKWASLWLNRHPIAHLIQHRFCRQYNGKLMWREINIMKEEIKKLKNSIHKYQTKLWVRRTELYTLITEQKKLCNEDTRASKVDTILISAISARITDDKPQTLLAAFFQQVPDAMLMMKDIISFVPIETCAEKLQKHLNTCTATHKCTHYFIAYECQNKGGRCSHYYEIEELQEELDRDEYYEDEDKDRLVRLEFEYERALAVKEDRLDEYLEYYFD